ncbi:uncharacterized protein LOC131206485 isoform X2 [Anopheles bellator]|uniref:uncharacterized protein LOC131206485 isoform X2 n=1 Tax=Anopheles bellator TaxID=139047 RepID=UPI002648C92B|nr:uncharacterized protein LOC131206485 isoform X2 [Anopheles bellator]
MGTKSVFFVLCLAALAVQDSQAQQRQSPARSALRYKRMFVMCPPDFIRIGNECYFISKNKLNWLDAYFECKDRNAKLAEPMKYEDKHLRRHLQKTMRKDDLWIGGTYNWNRHKWQWGHNGREMDYQSFSQMVPGQDLKYHCALLRSDLKFRWSAEECTKKVDFICQHRMPLVSEQSRNQVYHRWNETYPNQKANEKMVYIVNDPKNRTRNDPSKVRIYNSMKQVFRYNPSIQQRPGHRRTTIRQRKPTSRVDFIPNDVYRKQQTSQYAPDTANDLNTFDNGGHRGGYSSSSFNIDIRPRGMVNRNLGSPRTNNYRSHSDMARQEPMSHHQHRHQPTPYSSQLHKTPNRMHHEPPMHPRPVHYPQPTVATTTTTTTTTAAPRTFTETTTKMAPLTRQTTKVLMTPEQKKNHRELLRERLQKLTPEEQQIFLQDRARRKQHRLLQQQKHARLSDNEVMVP